MTAWQRLRAGVRHHRDRWLLGAADVALAASFLNPDVTLERALFEHVVVLDVTQSMNVTDAQLDGKPVSRLAYAKHALRESLLQLPCGSKRQNAERRSRRIGRSPSVHRKSYYLFGSGSAAFG